MFITTMRLGLDFSWPDIVSAPFREDFYIGAWHPSADLDVRIAPAPAGIDLRRITGANYVLLCNATDLQPGRTLVHAPILPGATEALAFRGYVVDPPLHGWSDPPAIWQYWARDLFRRHNGIFAAVRIGPAKLELITDAFGISPLYYRRLANGTVLFSTSPRYLGVAVDAGPDPVAARMLLHRGALCGDVSIVPDTTRCKPGHVISFSADRKQETAWFDFGSLPVGTEPIGDANLAEAERAFQQAMDRCLRLMPGAGRHLPLSSGDDSRRILAALIARREDFQALTVRVPQKQYRDLDGRFTAEMARALGFEHEVVELPEPREFAEDHHVVRVLVSGELREHAWMPPLVRRLRPHASLVFDGVGGDIFGNTGFAEPHWHTMPERGKLAALAREFLPLFPPYRESAFAPIQRAWEETERYLSILPEGPNRADYAFALIRARRGTGVHMQSVIPAGHVTVCPFFDLDHVEATMRIDSLDKIPEKLEARCLRVFWPEYYRFPGSRRIPPGTPEGPAEPVVRRKLACVDRMWAECGHKRLFSECRSILRSSYFVELLLASRSTYWKQRVEYWLANVLLVLSYGASPQPCWRPGVAAERPVAIATAT